MKHALLCLALLALPAQAATGEPVANPKPAGDPGRGKVAYEICRGCHKADGAGRADAGYPQLAGQHASVLAKQMTDIRAGRRPNPKMHPFIAEDVLPAADIADIAAYLAGLPVPPGNGKGDGRQLELGQRLYERDCAGCHGVRGEGDAGKRVPRLQGQHYGYLLRAGKAIQTGHGRTADPAIVRAILPYGDRELAAVGDYIARLTLAP